MSDIVAVIVVGIVVYGIWNFFMKARSTEYVSGNDSHSDSDRIVYTDSGNSHHNHSHSESGNDNNDD